MKLCSGLALTWVSDQTVITQAKIFINDEEDSLSIFNMFQCGPM